MPGLEWVIYALALVALWLGAMAAHGRFGGMPPAVVDVPQPTLAEGALTADELRTVRLAVVPRGYSIAQVDALLERVARQLDVAETHRDAADGDPSAWGADEGVRPPATGR